MVCEFGFSTKLGLINFEESEHSTAYEGIFSGRKPMSEETAARIDEEIVRLTDEAARSAREILSGHRSELNHLVEALLEHETLSGSQISELLGTNLPVVQETKSLLSAAQ